jgi:hypothetical protein
MTFLDFKFSVCASLKSLSLPSIVQTTTLCHLDMKLLLSLLLMKQTLNYVVLRIEHFISMLQS